MPVQSLSLPWKRPAALAPRPPGRAALVPRRTGTGWGSEATRPRCSAVQQHTGAVAALLPALAEPSATAHCAAGTLAHPAERGHSYSVKSPHPGKGWSLDPPSRVCTDRTDPPSSGPPHPVAGGIAQTPPAKRTGITGTADAGRRLRLERRESQSPNGMFPTELPKAIRDRSSLENTQNNDTVRSHEKSRPSLFPPGTYSRTGEEVKEVFSKNKLKRHRD